MASIITLIFLLSVLTLFLIKEPIVLLVGVVSLLTLHVSFWFFPGFILISYLIGALIEYSDKKGSS